MALPLANFHFVRPWRESFGISGACVSSSRVVPVRSPLPTAAARSSGASLPMVRASGGRAEAAQCLRDSLAARSLTWPSHGERTTGTSWSSLPSVAAQSLAAILSCPAVAQPRRPFCLLVRPERAMATAGLGKEWGNADGGLRAVGDSCCSRAEGARRVFLR